MPRLAVAQTAPAATTPGTETTTTTTAATPVTTAAPEQEEPTVLSPFVVDASEDKGSYKANSTLAGTRVRTDLKDVASAISVVTAQFLEDTGAKNAQDLLVYTPSTEVAGIRGNFSGSGQAIIATSVENTVSATTRVRGLDSADNTRDYFLTDIPWDSFDVGRVDLQRGPNSILFGTGSPAGIINVSTNGAAFNNSYNITNRVDEYGSLRDSVMLNQEIIPGILAIRLGALQDDEKYEQAAAFENTTRYYGAFRFDPKIFGKDSHTSIRGNFEKGTYTADAPRDLPPYDEITPWFSSSISVGGVTNPGYNHITENQYGLNNTALGLTGLPGGSGGPISENFFQMNAAGIAEGRVYWPDVQNFFEATPQSRNSTPGSVAPSGGAIKVITGAINTGLAAGGSIGGLPSYRPDAMPDFAAYAQYVGVPSNGDSPALNAMFTPIPGGAYYTDKVITDPSIFNFYKYLLDGPNKHEWKSWNAFDLAVDQTFFDDRIGIEFAYDQQKYTEGAEPWMEGTNYGINIDVNQTYADGSPNPNVGRPNVANAASGGEDNNYQTTTTRQVYRVTPTVEVRTSDFTSNSFMTYLLGKSNFTGLYEKNTVVQFNYQFAEFATTPEYTLDNFINSAATAAEGIGSNRSFEWLAYIGPNLSSAPSASGANLNYLNFTLAPQPTENVRNFNSTYNSSVSPSATGFNYTNTASGVVTTNTTQNNNPANYVGWQNEGITYMFASNPQDLPGLVSSATRSRYQDESIGVTWQGYLLGGDFVPSLGWRKDKIVNYLTSSPEDQTNGFVSLSFPDNLATRTDVAGISKTWGGVYHLPKAIMGKLPYDMTFSLLFDRSENFKTDPARLDYDGNPIPNATGTTTDFGFVATALADKITLKVDWFKTTVKNAALGSTNGNSIGGLSQNSYFIADGVIWGYGWATALQDGLRGNLGNGQSSVTPGSNYWDYGAGNGLAVGSPAYLAVNAASQGIINAWVNNPFSKNYFFSYNLTPPIDPTVVHTTGNLRDGFLNGVNDANGPDEGGGSTFGDHVSTVDNLSKGVEVEVSMQPIRNWNLTLNFSHVDATHTNIDPAMQKFISQITGFMNGPGGQIRMWCNSCGTLGSDWNSSIVYPWTVLLNDQGHEAPEVAPWRLNAVSTYGFDRGFAKGWFVGGALRMEAGRILGYHFDPNWVNVNSTDPNYANVSAVTKGGLNVNEPWRGPTDTHVDAWIGYSRKVYRNVNWRVQLNLQSVGEKDTLVPAAIEPDGSYALMRIQEGMGWRLENSFDF
ncbi:MAG TPA: TonB-dependent receptor plug domain-containing protein [Opitutaceae bacterium]|nr:TonB-dependent receptor plug domain-containing protein [Opitutaceae bacterium]